MYVERELSYADKDDVNWEIWKYRNNLGIPTVY